MRIVIERSGGFAGVTKRDVADPAPPAVESLAREAERTPPSHDALPDAFQYDVTIDGREYVVRNPDAAWRTLIEAVGRVSHPPPPGVAPGG